MEKLHLDRKISWDNILGTDNIAELLDDNDLNKIGDLVKSEYEYDVESRSVWDKLRMKIEDLIKPIPSKGGKPWANASNSRYPILTKAAIQFSSRALSALLPDDRVAKGKVRKGDDVAGQIAKRAEMLGEELSDRIISLPKWKRNQDKLLTRYSIFGTEFKKIYWDADISNVVCELVSGKDLVVDYWAKDIDKAARATHRYVLYNNEIETRKRRKQYLKIDVTSCCNIPDYMGNSMTSGDQKAIRDNMARPHLILEQHRWLDLDGDGYEEPYVVTLHYDTAKVLRISHRIAEYEREGNEVISIDPQKIFVDYSFRPSFDDSVYGVGYGFLLYHLCACINAAINQLNDAGTLNTLGGGLVSRGISMKERRVKMLPAEYKVADFAGDDIRKHIYDRPSVRPSPVSFQLLGLMIQSTERFASITDINEGESPGSNVPATSVLALIEQGQSVHTRVYEGAYESLAEEITLIHGLYQKYDDTYEYTDIDDQVMLVANPRVLTNTQKLFIADELMKFFGMGLNDDEILKRKFESMNVPDIEAIMPQMKINRQPDPEMENKRIELDIKDREQQVEEILKNAQAQKTLAETAQIQTQTAMESNNTEQTITDLNTIIQTLVDSMPKNDTMSSSDGGTNGQSGRDTDEGRNSALASAISQQGVMSRLAGEGAGTADTGGNGSITGQ